MSSAAPKRQARIPKYDNTLPNRIVELGGQGYCVEQIKFELNLKQNAILEYSKQHPEFKAALAEAKSLADKVVAERRKRPIGRPTLYKPEYCELVVSMGMGNPEEGFMGGGHSIAQMARAIGVAVSTLYEWRDNHPEFSEALTWAQDMAEAWWEDKSHAGIDVQGFNGGLWKIVMSARFPTRYREPSKIELTGKDGAPLPAPVAAVAVTAEEVREAMKAFAKEF